MRVLLILLLLSACQTAAESCRPERLAELPLRLLGKVPAVTAEINGQTATLLLDTGSDRTVLSRAAAARLGVAERAPGLALRGAGGEAASGKAVLDRLTLGGVALRSVPVLLANQPDAPLDGVLGIDFLVDYELELDVPHGRAALYRARSCATARPDWAGRVIALPVQQQAGSGHLFVSISVDGETLHGLLDTGATVSTLSLQAAEDTGLRAKVLDRQPRMRAQTMNAGGIVFRPVQFRELRVGADTVENPVLTVADLPPFAGDLLLGEDYIGKRKLWFWFRLGRVFVSPE